MKRNWFGQDQKRFFELYHTGLIRYFDIKGKSKEVKGTTRISSKSLVIQNTDTAPPSIEFRCQIKKNKDYILIQPLSEQVVSFSEQKKQGNSSVIEQWHAAMNEVIEELKAKEQNDRFMMNVDRDVREESERYS